MPASAVDAGGAFLSAAEHGPMEAAEAAARMPAREYGAIGLIGVIHAMSHLYQLALPPLFVLAKPELGVSYAALGFVMTVHFVATALFQTPVGFLVDRIGGRKVLIAGLFLNGAAIAGAGLVSSYWPLVALFLVAGIGNAVFHPADFSLLAAAVDERRIGRAFSAHSMGGTAGTAAAPPIVVALASLWDWRAALLAVGVAGMALAVSVLVFRNTLGEAAAPRGRRANKGANAAKDAKENTTRAEAKGGPGWRFLLSRPMIVFFLFYTFSSAANSGMTNFSVVAIGDVYGAPLAVATGLLTVFLVAGTVGVVPGGFLADATRRHDLVLMVAYLLLAASVLAVGTGAPPIWLVFALVAVGGTMRGLVGPSRDILVRQAAPEGAIGTAFAFVTTGFMVGNSLVPALYGWLMDIGLAQGVFFVSAAFTLLGLSTVFLTKERSL